MIGPFIHNIDPVFAKVGVFYLWWYGLSYTFGFFGIFFWLHRQRQTLLMNLDAVYDLTIFMAIGILIGGRMIEVVFYEWPYYKSHLWHIPAIWLGGMSTHGILFGAILGLILFCKRYKRDFFEIADVMAIAGAFLMGVGRIGNFIDGQIIGSVTDGFWGVKFPDAEGFRHPVVLYDGIKNLLLIPFLLMIRSTKPPRGVILGHFILWYGFLRIFVDFFRQYRSTFLDFPPGQEFNVLMTVVGLCLLVWFYRQRKNTTDNSFATRFSVIPPAEVKSRIWLKKIIFVSLLILPAVIPSDWTQDIPERYGKRHADLNYSVIYPKIDFSNR